METIQQSLADFPSQLSVVVQWGDMDAAQHVNNLIYLRWAETARIDFFRKLEIFTTPNDPEGVILSKQTCKYIFPVTFPDTVFVGTRVSEIKADRFMLQSHIYSQQHQRIVAIVDHELVPYSYVELTKIPLPAVWKDRIVAIQPELGEQ